MKLFIRSTLMATTLATGVLAYAAPAPMVHVAPQPVYVQQPGIAYGEPHDQRHEWERRRDRDFCGAPRWDPQVRYMPGNMVRHQGRLYVARRVSARVYNVNSPPSQTPNYWVRARC